MIDKYVTDQEKGFFNHECEEFIIPYKNWIYIEEMNEYMAKSSIITCNIRYVGEFSKRILDSLICFSKLNIGGVKRAGIIYKENIKRLRKVKKRCKDRKREVEQLRINELAESVKSLK